MVKELKIKNELAELNRTSGFLQAIAEEWKLSNQLFMNLNLAIEEVLTNIILYAYPGKSNKDIFLRMEKEGNRLVVTISDLGIPFDPTQKPTPDVTLTADERPIGGLGIFLVQQVMTNVTYLRKEGKNILTMSKELH